MSWPVRRVPRCNPAPIAVHSSSPKRLPISASMACMASSAPSPSVATVTVDTRGDYPELRGVRLSEVEAGAVDFSEAVKDSGEGDYGDLPF